MYRGAATPTGTIGDAQWALLGWQLCHRVNGERCPEGLGGTSCSGCLQTGNRPSLTPEACAETLTFCQLNMPLGSMVVFTRCVLTTMGA